MKRDFIWELFKLTGSIYAALYMLETEKEERIKEELKIV